MPKVLHFFFFFGFYTNKRICNIFYSAIWSNDKITLSAWFALYCLVIEQHFHNILINVREEITIILRFVCKQNS